MKRCLAVMTILVSMAACATSSAGSGDPTASEARPRDPLPTEWFLQANLAGGWADGAEASGADDVVLALVDRVRELEGAPAALFLNEACESHAAGVATGLGSGWRWFFVPSWPGHSDCFPAPGTTEGRFGNAVVVRDPAATAVVVPSCNDPNAPADGCIPNWAPPAEQRRAICATGPPLRCSVHLDPRAWQWHGEQLDAIARIAVGLARRHGRVVVGGDFNTGRGRVVRAFEGAATASGEPAPSVAITPGLRTYPAERPDRDLDHLVHVSMTEARWVGARTLDLGSCAATWHDDGRCTDHLAVVAGLEAPLRDRSGPRPTGHAPSAASQNERRCPVREPRPTSACRESTR